MTYDYDTLSLLSYINIQKNNNLNLLLKKKFRNKKHDIDLSLLFDKISMQFIDSINSFSVRNKMEVLFDILELEKEHKVLESCLTILFLENVNIASDVNKLLKAYGFEIDFDNLEQSVNKIYTRLKGIAVRISILRINNSKLFEERIDEKEYNVYKDTLIVGRVLEERINPSKITLPEWAERIKLAEEISKFK